MSRTKVIIIGAAGRDFHNFNTVYRNNENFEVVAFTATQIPEIDGRKYPVELAGQLYPQGIPIYDMAELEQLIHKLQADVCVFSYSDAHYVTVMQVANRVLSAGANFQLLAPRHGFIKSTKPLISVLAVRTGCGKSQTTRRIVKILREELGVKRVVSVRHPMPYGDLAQQAAMRFATLEDLKTNNCTIEEMEEYEPHIAAGNVIYSGVDYEMILRQAEAEADVILWDGGNNDPSFYASDLMITVADPLRAGHELQYWAGETNVSLSDIVIINKCDSARPEDIELVKANVRSRNPQATIITADSPVSVEQPELVRGKRVLVVEDGPTLTHGEMSIGAGYVAARQLGAAEIVRPEPYAVGSIKAAYAKFKQITEVLPALGYYDEQLKEMEQTIAAVPCDCVVIGTPIDLRRVINIRQPSTRVNYELREHDPELLRQAVARVVGK